MVPPDGSFGTDHFRVKPLYRGPRLGKRYFPGQPRPHCPLVVSAWKCRDPTLAELSSLDACTVLSPFHPGVTGPTLQVRTLPLSLVQTKILTVGCKAPSLPPSCYSLTKPHESFLRSQGVSCEAPNSSIRQLCNFLHLVNLSSFSSPLLGYLQESPPGHPLPTPPFNVIHKHIGFFLVCMYVWSMWFFPRG